SSQVAKEIVWIPPDRSDHRARLVEQFHRVLPGSVAPLEGGFSLPGKAGAERAPRDEASQRRMLTLVIRLHARPVSTATGANRRHCQTTRGFATTERVLQRNALWSARRNRRIRRGRYRRRTPSTYHRSVAW